MLLNTNPGVLFRFHVGLTDGPVFSQEPIQARPQPSPRDGAAPLDPGGRTASRPSVEHAPRGLSGAGQPVVQH